MVGSRVTYGIQNYAVPENGHFAVHPPGHTAAAAVLRDINKRDSFSSDT
jgi:hypothetical protein